MSRLRHHSRCLLLHNRNNLLSLGLHRSNNRHLGKQSWQPPPLHFSQQFAQSVMIKRDGRRLVGDRVDYRGAAKRTQAAVRRLDRRVCSCGRCTL
jgi:hypothetical protein